MTNTNGKFVRALGALVWILFVTLTSAELSAQEWRMRPVEPLPPPAVDTNNVETLNPREVGEAGETTDLGPQIVLQRHPNPPFLSLSSDTQYLFDSNVGLTPNHQVSDALFFETLSAAFTPHLVEQLSSAIYLRQQFVRYDEQSILDFDAQTAGLSLAYPVNSWFTAYGGFAASRLFSRQNGDEFYKEFDTQFGLWRSQALGRRISLYYGYQFDWLPSQPSDLTEVEDALYGGINLQPIDRLTAQFLYRFRVRDYLQVGRTDLDHLVSLAVTYTFCRYASVRAYATYGDNDSNKNEFDYRVANAGGALSLSVKF